MRRIRWFSALLALMLLLSAGALAEEKEEAQFYGVIGKRLDVHRAGKENSSVYGTVEPGEVVDVYAKGRTWTRIGFGERQGYVLTKFVERIQRKDPFGGSMPGTSEHLAVGYVMADTSFKPEGYKYAVNVKKGSWVSVEKIKDGRVYFPYKRETHNVSLDADNLRLYRFFPWDEARPGDLLYAFTTFYTTSLKKEGNAGRYQRKEKVNAAGFAVGFADDFSGHCAQFHRNGTGERVFYGTEFPSWGSGFYQ